jgi:hypothetical protein
LMEKQQPDAGDDGDPAVARAEGLGSLRNLLARTDALVVGDWAITPPRTGSARLRPDTAVKYGLAEPEDRRAWRRTPAYSCGIEVRERLRSLGCHADALLAVPLSEYADRTS